MVISSTYVIALMFHDVSVSEVGIAVDSVNTTPVTPVLRKVAFELKEQQVALALLIPVER